MGTVLHMVAHDGDAELTGRILARAPDLVNKQDKSGFSALHLAARGRHAEVVKLLLDARADRDLRAMVGDRTALELARTNGADGQLLALLGDSDEDPVAVAT